jgi:hypothetical protein
VIISNKIIRRLAQQGASRLYVGLDQHKKTGGQKNKGSIFPLRNDRLRKF